MSKVKKQTRDTTLRDRLITDDDILVDIVKQHKKDGKKIVMTQGVYDLIHEGHAKYLQKAKSHGDMLIVGIDSDELTKLRKGPKRPIVPEDERIEMLLHLRHVDYVTVHQVRHGTTDLVALVRPDILITSASTEDITDEVNKTFKGICGQVIVLPPQATTSTTARIRLLTIDGAEQLAGQIDSLIKDFIGKIRSS